MYYAALLIITKGNYDMAKISRKKFQEALKVLKGACKNESLPWKLRIHAAEMVLSIYGADVPNDDGRSGKLIRDLVNERAFRKGIRTAAEANERERQAQEQQKTASLMEAALNGDSKRGDGDAI
jgi:hypothetical protein